MTATNNILRLYGEDISVGTAKGKGFISCLDADNAQIHRQPLTPGVKNGSKYRLITNMEDISEGAQVKAAGEYTRCSELSLSAFSAPCRITSASSD